MKSKQLTWNQARNLLETGIVKKVAYSAYPDCIFYLRDGKVRRIWQRRESDAKDMCLTCEFIVKE